MCPGRKTRNPKDRETEMRAEVLMRIWKKPVGYNLQRGAHRALQAKGFNESSAHDSDALQLAVFRHRRLCSMTNVSSSVAPHPMNEGYSSLHLWRRRRSSAYCRRRACTQWDCSACCRSSLPVLFSLASPDATSTELSPRDRSSCCLLYTSPSPRD